MASAALYRDIESSDARKLPLDAAIYRISERINDICARICVSAGNIGLYLRLSCASAKRGRLPGGGAIA